MNTAFWARMHGGSTHFPIALLLASLVFDFLALVVKSDEHRRDLRAAAYWSLLLAALGSFGAVLSGLIISGFQTGGAGLLLKHHLFVWPAFGLVVALAVWRLVVRQTASKGAYNAYLIALIIASGFMAIAGYWGGEILLGSS
ncbi:MAG TPA: DUF2231 domain-containing protein [Capsulimonadaceae bacterium]|nr:DUF2231 domain-containing protein [Capsulimonadaceae bacterium]